MGRPSEGYYVAGVRVPSVTDIIGKFKNPAPLVGWAFKRGYESGQNAARGLPAPRSAYAEAEQAATAGQIAHDMLECYIQKRPYVYEGKRLAPGVMDRATNGFNNGVRWLAQTQYVIEDTETSLISAKHMFGGTRDAKARAPSRGKRLIDWKTSNAVYADYLVQVSAYDILEEEQTGEPFEGYDILRFSKEHADFEHRSFEDLSEAKAAFLLMTQLYPLVTRLEERV
jgi:hypothetical protein